MANKLRSRFPSRWTYAMALVTHLPTTQDDSSIAQEEEESNAQIEDVLGLQHLEDLLRVFKAHRPRPPSSGGPLPTNHRPGKLDIREFKSTMAVVLGTHKYDGQLENLFNKLDISHDNFVDWNEFTTYVLQQLREKDFLTARKFRPFRGEPRIRHIVHNRQETTSKVLYIDSPFRYITVGREGAVSVWSAGLNLETHFEVCDDAETDRNRKRRVKLWVNDAVYLPNCRKLAIITTGRDIHFYEVTSGQYIKEVHLYGLEDVPCCLDFWYDKKYPTGKCRLFVGDDEGNIHFFNFLQPAISLFNPSKKNMGPQRIYFPDLRRHSRYVEHSTLERVHTDMVRQVCYLPENGYILSASTSIHHSLVLRDELGKKRTYVFNVTKGVECFAYNKPLNLLVTGSADHMVRVWNPYVTHRPVAVLSGHAVGIVDVAIHQALTIILSYSKDAVLKVWDPSEHTCLQTVNIKFPCAVHGPLLEHGPFSLCMTASRAGVLLVAAQDYLAHLRLSPSGTETSQSTTHLAQLCAAIYNPNFKQVVTAADDSSMGMWDLETGRKAMMFTECHAQEEITCLTFDPKFQRVITGARDGSIKTWSAQTGQCMQQLEPVAEAEVTGVVSLIDRPVLLSVGWSRKISTYDDSNPENSPVTGDTAWPGGQHHKDDILSAAYLGPLLLATGSYDGAIYVWSMEKCSLLVQLKAPSDTTKSSNRTTKSGNICEPSPQMNPHTSPHPCSRPNSRPNSRHRSDHRTPKGLPAPVDALLFLPSRDRRTEGALLVSTSGGVIRWWSIYSKRHLVGAYYAPVVPDESILAICTDPANRLLGTGDTAGHLTLWDISEYCLSPEPRTIRHKPPVLGTWLAHEGAIVSVAYIEHSTASGSELLLSASTDRLAKLWTCSGHCIGAFGQKQLWNLQTPSTWVNPFVIGDAATQNAMEGKDETAEGIEAAENLHNEVLRVSPNGPSVHVESPRDGQMPQGSPNSSLQIPQMASPGRAEPAGTSRTRTPVTDVKMLSNTPRSKTGLGLRVDQEFERRRCHREKRRAALSKGSQETHGSTDFLATCGRNTQTTFPFHSLDMKPLEDVTFPGTLTPRNLTSLMTSQKPSTRHQQRAPPSGSEQISELSVSEIVTSTQGLTSVSSSSIDEQHNPLRLPDIRKNHTTIGITLPNQGQQTTSGSDSDSVSRKLRPARSAKV